MVSGGLWGETPVPLRSQDFLGTLPAPSAELTPVPAPPGLTGEPQKPWESPSVLPPDPGRTRLWGPQFSDPGTPANSGLLPASAASGVTRLTLDFKYI